MPDFAARVRAALADRGLSMRAAARAISYDPAYLSRVLSGKQEPSEQLAQALDNLLDANGGLIELARLLTPDDRGRLSHAIAHPTRLDRKSVHVLNDVLIAQRRLDDAMGAAITLPAADAQFTVIAKTIKSARGKARGAIVDIGAQWALFNGWLYVALGQHGPAAQRFHDAADLAMEAGNNSLLASVYAFKGYAAGRRGEAATKEGLTAAARNIPGVHPAQRAYNAFQHARAFTEMGERDEGARMLEEASTLLDEAGSAGAPPPWGYWYTPAFFKLNIGMTQAQLGVVDVAEDMITSGLAELPEDQQSSDWAEEFQQALKEAKEAKEAA